MEIEYERDHARRRVTVTLRGAYQAGDVLVLLERHRVEDDWRDARLYVLRDVTGAPTIDDLRQFMKLDTQHRPHGPEAIVTSNPILYGLACTYAALAQTLRIEVFRETCEAVEWLAAQTGSDPDPETVPPIPLV